MAGTRGRILAVAQDLFLQRGYHAAALQEIADRVGITKPALYYHFASKAEILAALLDPLTTELEQVFSEAVERGAVEGIHALRESLMTGWLDVFLSYRGTLVALMRELAAIQSHSFARLVGLMEYAIDAAAGAEAGMAERIAVAQAISAITDPIALLPGTRNEDLREHILAGVWRLFDGPVRNCPERDRPADDHRVGTGGRPRRLTSEDIARARELRDSGEHSVPEIADRLGVSRATLYRRLKTG